MIHILTEDSTNGFELCKHIRENPIVDMNISDANQWLIQTNNREKVFWIPTNSFEIELMLIMGIEWVCDSLCYRKYFEKLRDKYYDHLNITDLTKITKQDDLYKPMYEKAKKEKSDRLIYQQLSSTDFEKAFTIETISKDIFNKIFANAPIDRPMNGCWQTNCCTRRKHCKNQFLDMEKLIRIHTQIDMYKTRWLITNTSYKKIVETVYRLQGSIVFSEEYDIYDLYLESDERNDRRYDQYNYQC